MTEAEVVERVAMLADAESWPELDWANLEAAVVAARRVDAAGNPPENVTGVAGWVTATAYVADSLILESGRYWKATVAGTSGAFEPSWPNLSGRAIGGFSVLDGGVVWNDNGGVWAGSWDVAFAAAEAWRIKAGKVAGAHTFQTDGQMFNRAQVHRHCLEQVDHYLKQRAFVA